MFCTNCGKQLDDNSKFCPSCGTKLERVEIPVAAAAAMTEPEVPAPEPTPAPEPEQIRQEAPAPEQAWQEAPTSEPTPAPEPEQVWQEAPAPEPTPAPEQKKSKKGLIIGLIAGGVVLIAAIVVALILILPNLLNRKVTINFMDYAGVEFSGYDHVGEAEATFDIDRLLEDYGEQIKYSRRYRGYGNDPISDFESSLYWDLEFEDRYDLSNGDEVTYELYVTGIGDIFNVEIAEKPELTGDDAWNDAILTREFTVSGLKEAEAFDPFEGIEVEVTGNEPFGELNFNLDNCPDPIKEYYAISADKYYDLSNGDIVTLTVDEWLDDEFIIEEYGMVPSRRSMEYTVSGLGTLLTSVTQLSASAEQDLKSICDDIFLAEIDSLNAENQTTDKYEIVGSVLKYAKEPTQFGPNNNTLSVVYKHDSTVRDTSGATADQAITTYSIIEFDNIYFSGDELIMDPDNYYVTYHRYSFSRGSWTISGYYAYETMEEVRDYLMDKDPSYEYEDNLPK